MANFIEALDELGRKPVAVIAVAPVDTGARALLQEEKVRRLAENKARILPQIRDELIPGLRRFKQEFLANQAGLEVETEQAGRMTMIWGVHQEMQPTGELVNPNGSSVRREELHEVGNQFSVFISYATGAVILDMGRKPRGTWEEISPNLLEDPDWQAKLATQLVHTLQPANPKVPGFVVSSLGFHYDINLTDPRKNELPRARFWFLS